MAKATAVRVSTGKKFSQLLIITPAVAIDSNEHDDYHGPFNSSSLDSGCGGSSEGSLSDELLDEDEQRRQHRRRQTAGMVSGDRRNNNNNNGTTQRLPPLLLDGNRERHDGGGGGASTSQQGSWRWCGLICSAVKCFRAAAATTAGSRRGQPGPSSRQPLAGTAVRYTTTESVWSGGAGRRPGASRFSNNHVYEYTIKSYRQPQRRSNGGPGSVTLPPTGGGPNRSDSISSGSSALSEAAGTLADHDHINNNSAVGNSNGTILSSSSAGGTGSIVIATMIPSSSGASSPTVGRVATERNNIMYKL
uniref:Uncharacterized protein n=1 Tax=Anopheles stephensi TaxID=30069 RepID=A0A182YG87_ANOST